MEKGYRKFYPQAFWQRNRKFNCKMRDLYYEKSYYRFIKLIEHLDSEQSQDEAKRRALVVDFHKEVSTCAEYAEAAIIGYKRQKIKKFRVDREYGILEEEIILVTFLHELLSSVSYLIHRIDTDSSLNEFESQLEKNKGKSHNTQKGFVDNLLESLNHLKDASQGEFQKVFELIKHRYSIGNKLFSIICDLQQLSTKMSN
jgi:hypothetical protein